MTEREWAELKALRALLTPQYNDEYAVQTARQREGDVCSHCGSRWGHYSRCVLLNHVTATD